jgi:hypothetical protein
MPKKFPVDSMLQSFGDDLVTADDKVNFNVKLINGTTLPLLIMG